MVVQITSNVDKFEGALRDVLPSILEAWGITAEGYAKFKCPVDTGRLRNSITHKRNDTEGFVQIGTDVEYASYVEFGTSRGRAQPYLTPAIMDHLPEYEKIADDWLKRN